MALYEASLSTSVTWLAIQVDTLLKLRYNVSFDFNLFLLGNSFVSGRSALGSFCLFVFALAENRHTHRESSPRQRHGQRGGIRKTKFLINRRMCGRGRAERSEGGKKDK